MIEQILDFIHNYFVKEIHKGTFQVSSGVLNVDFLRNGQYFKVVGSIFNDGVYKYGVDTLTDEEFEGEVWSMAVPPAVIAIADEIEDWVDKYGTIAESPYQSESFGGYSYSKAQGGNSGGTGNKSTWQSIFGSRLNAYRKLS